MSLFLNGDRKHQLVFGYSRTNCHSLVPTDVILQVLRFYDNTIYWILKGDELEHFFDCKDRSYLTGPKFTLYDVEFENTLCPNGWYHNGYTSYFLELKQLPPHVHCITIEYVLYCEQIDYSCKRSVVYCRGEKEWHGWGDPAVRFAQFAPKQHKFDSLEFDCSIDVLYVGYNKGLRYYQGISLSGNRKETLWNPAIASSENESSKAGPDLFGGDDSDSDSSCD